MTIGPGGVVAGCGQPHWGYSERFLSMSSNVNLRWMTHAWDGERQWDRWIRLCFYSPILGDEWWCNAVQVVGTCGCASHFVCKMCLRFVNIKFQNAKMQKSKCKVKRDNLPEFKELIFPNKEEKYSSEEKEFGSPKLCCASESSHIFVKFFSQLWQLTVFQ